MAQLNMELLKNFKPATQSNWDLKWGSSSGLPSRYQNWFPATDVEETPLSVESKTFSFPMQDFRIPIKVGSPMLSITFLEDLDQSFRKWLYNWVWVDIFNEGRFISPISKWGKMVTVRQLDDVLQAVPDMTKNYVVFPEGALTFTGSSSKEFTSRSQQFVIIG